jgi:hypothetical protein
MAEKFDELGQIFGKFSRILNIVAEKETASTPVTGAKNSSEKSFHFDEKLIKTCSLLVWKPG